MSRMHPLLPFIVVLLAVLAATEPWSPRSQVLAASQEPPNNCQELFSDPGARCPDFCQQFSLATYNPADCIDVVWSFSTPHGECHVQGLTCKEKKPCNYNGVLSVELEEGCEGPFYFCGEHAGPGNCGDYHDDLNWGTGGGGINISCGTNAHLEVRDGGEQGPIAFNIVFECCACLALGGGGGL